MLDADNFVYRIIIFDDQDSWNTVLRVAASHLDKRGMLRLKRVLEDECGCVLVEKHYIDRDYRDTFSKFHSKRFRTPDARCIRLHFFRDAVTEESLLKMSQCDSCYLGYSVIRPTKPNCIGRTFLSHHLRLNKAAHMSLCEERVNLLGVPLKIQGFPFISQDTDATVCAESALWMVLRYYSTRYTHYSEILPFQITDLANNYSWGSRVYPSAGLFSWQLAEALRLQNFSPVIYSRGQYKHFDHLLYTYVESGLPLLVTVPEHVVATYGHVSDYSEPWPHTGELGSFLYTSYFNRAWVISDDNHFPYQLLHNTGPKQPLDSIYSWSQIEEFIVPLPEKVFLTAELAQTAIEEVLTQTRFGIESSPALQGRRLIYRLYLGLVDKIDVSRVEPIFVPIAERGVSIS